MSTRILVPELGESVNEANVIRWLKHEGQPVHTGETVVELETDKIDLQVEAERDGVLAKIEQTEGKSVKPGDVLGFIEEGTRAELPAAAPSKPTTSEKAPSPETPVPSATHRDVSADDHREQRQKMSMRRQTIARRLVEAQRSTASLTTFNEIDMSKLMQLRDRRTAGITAFFVRAAIGALKEFPVLNAEVRSDEVVLKQYFDIGIAVAADEGLVVPVIRDADRLSISALDTAIRELAQRSKEKTLSLEDLRGGTFTITNGGVFGSLLSTPILNAPQVGILGLHEIKKRPTAVDGNVEVRPMMYVALTYDHRLVDGREAVQFLVRVKDLIEDPDKMLLEA